MRRFSAADIPVLVCAVMMSAALVTGYSFSQATIDNAYTPLFSPVMQTLAAIALAALFFVLLTLLFRAIDNRMSKGWKRLSANGILARHPFFVPSVIIAVCWLPYWIACFPGSLPYDGARSMNQFITDAPLQNHHPVAMNALYAGLMTLGRIIHSDNTGLLLIVGFQYVCCVVAFSATVYKLIRDDAPKFLVVLSLLYFALDPVWGISAQAAYKDTLFNAVFVCFALTIASSLKAVCTSGKSCVGKGSESGLEITQRLCSVNTTSQLHGLAGVAPLFLASLAMCFTRNNGIYVVALTFIVLVIYTAVKRRGIKQMACAGSVAIALYLVAALVVWPAIGVEMHEDKEMMSVPLQQTARYLLEHPDDVTEEEREAIEAILPYDNLATLYIPSLSDPVKESISSSDESLNSDTIVTGNITSEEREAYFNAWLSMGMRHPLTYVRAFIANTYAYLYPFEIIGNDDVVARAVFPFGIQEGEINHTSCHYVFPEAEFALSQFFEGQLDIPVLSLIYSPATYVWVFLIMLAYATRSRNARALLLAIPFLGLLITVAVGPLNGHLRYVLPVAAALPIYVSCALDGTFIKPSSDKKDRRKVRKV